MFFHTTQAPMHTAIFQCIIEVYLQYDNYVRLSPYVSLEKIQRVLENAYTGIPANPAFDIIVPQFKSMIGGRYG